MDSKSKRKQNEHKTKDDDNVSPWKHKNIEWGINEYCQRVKITRNRKGTKNEKKHIDFVFFATPSPKPFYLQKLNYSITVMDICHKDYPEFSEVSEYNIFYLREKLLQTCIGPSTFVIVESEKLKEKISNQFNKPKHRIVVLPNRPSPFLTKIKIDETNKNINQFKFKDDYFFYPAQFWEHKNHIRIILALKKLKEKGKNLNFVFCGSDKGNKNFIINKIKEYDLVSNFKVFNFVSFDELHILYRNCKAVVMPTYFGPTNIPPLDAWYFEKPLIYSNHLIDQSKNAALHFDPGSTDELVNCLLKIDDKEICEKLINNGKLRLIDISKSRLEGEDVLIEKLSLFENKKETWS